MEMNDKSLGGIKIPRPKKMDSINPSVAAKRLTAIKKFFVDISKASVLEETKVIESPGQCVAPHVMGDMPDKPGEDADADALEKYDKALTTWTRDSNALASHHKVYESKLKRYREHQSEQDKTVMAFRTFFPEDKFDQLLRHPSYKSPAAKRARGANWSKPEKLDAMIIITEVLPAGKNEWNQVASELDDIGHGKNRSAQSVRSMYRKLLAHPKGTGEPTCPTPVKMAKRADYHINAKKDTLTICDSEDSEYLSGDDTTEEEGSGDDDAPAPEARVSDDEEDESSSEDEFAALPPPAMVPARSPNLQGSSPRGIQPLPQPRFVGGSPVQPRYHEHRYPGETIVRAPDGTLLHASISVEDAAMEYHNAENEEEVPLAVKKSKVRHTASSSESKSASKSKATTASSKPKAATASSIKPKAATVLSKSKAASKGVKAPKVDLTRSPSPKPKKTPASTAAKKAKAQQPTQRVGLTMDELKALPMPGDRVENVQLSETTRRKRALDTGITKLAAPSPNGKESDMMHAMLLQKAEIESQRLVAEDRRALERVEQLASDREERRLDREERQEERRMAMEEQREERRRKDRMEEAAREERLEARADQRRRDKLDDEERAIRRQREDEERECRLEERRLQMEVAFQRRA
ncbi:hypothetical protein HDU98_003881 [Podochytrium sp. JEL0797]|nr:hypothetical protein HDU98_003881 [Podochytrium sp. JEL0797]